MDKILLKIENSLAEGKFYIESFAEDIHYKSHPEKWSKKEIIGYLIDSGMINLQRIIQVKYGEKPFVIKDYQQDELVRAIRRQI